MLPVKEWILWTTFEDGKNLKRLVIAIKNKNKKIIEYFLNFLSNIVKNKREAKYSNTGILLPEITIVKRKKMKERVKKIIFLFLEIGKNKIKKNVKKSENFWIYPPAIFSLPKSPVKYLINDWSIKFLSKLKFIKISAATKKDKKAEKIKKNL